MAVRKTGTIIVKGTSGKSAKIVIPGMTDLQSGKTFIMSIETAAMEGSCVADSYAETEKIPAVVDGGNTDRKGVILYQDNTAGINKRISIPSWGTDEGDSVMQEGGERIPLVMCQTIVEALETASGRSLTALEGYVIQGK